jgi:hypothetical protein
MLYGFQGLSMHIPLSFKGDGLDPIRLNNVYHSSKNVTIRTGLEGTPIEYL